MQVEEDLVDEWVGVGLWDINIHTDSDNVYVTAYNTVDGINGWRVTNTSDVAWQIVKPLSIEGGQQ